MLRALLLLTITLLPFTVTDATAGSASTKAEQIVMYVMPQCGYCERARSYLRERGLDWREIDIAASAEAKAEFDARGGAGTPLIFVGEQRVSGFDRERLAQLLDALES